MMLRLQRLLPLRWRAAALLPAAALSVHQLRFLLAFGDGAGAELERQGHAYLGLLAPFVAILAAAGVGLFVARLLEAWSEGGDSGERGRAPSFPRLWLTIAALLVAIYTGQELLEGALVAAHDGGLASAFGSGGLLAIPAALAVAAAVAALLRGAEAAIAWVARRRCRPRRRRPASPFAPCSALLPRTQPAGSGGRRARPTALLVTR